MKFFCWFFFLTIITFAHAQPGDIMAMQKAQLQKIQTALQNDPNNMSLVWKRLELTFKPHFDLYKNGATFEGFQQRGFEYPHYILEDLNYLIANNVSIKIQNKETVSLADYYFKRGQFYYVTGYPEYALEDYLLALQHNPAFPLKKKICLSIAAYYYTSDTHYSLEKYEKALVYIDLVTPKEDINKPYLHYNSIQNDPFQREKILLLKASQKTERFVEYLQCIAKKHINFYKIESEKSTAYQKSHSYTIRYSLQLGFNKLYEIAQHFYETGNYKIAKGLIEKVISFLPRNKDGHYYESYAYGNYFLFLSKIYRTDPFQNIPLEIDNLLEGLGDLTQGLPSQASKEYKRLEELVQLYPNEPKLHLAKAIYLIKYSRSNRYNVLKENPLDYLQQCETVGLKDYRIWYAKAMLLYQEKKYTVALEEINKAQLLCTGYVNIYALKLRLLRNIESSTEVEMTTEKSLLEASRKQEKVNTTALLEMINVL